MDIIEAIILGLVQGLTEFLPISSSGHLVLVRHYFGGVKEPGIFFEVLLHLGTLFAVFVYFRKEIMSLISSVLPKGSETGGNRAEKRKMVAAIICGTIPTVIIALLFKDIFESIFNSVTIVSAMLLITGVLLYSSDLFTAAKRTDVTMRDAIIIGIVQGLAIIPGISRSGSTIAAGIFRGIKGEQAATYSFMLSIPAILGAVVLHAKDINSVPESAILPYLAGVVVSAISGFVSISVLMKIVSGRRLKFFAIYCWIVGGTSLIFNM